MLAGHRRRPDPLRPPPGIAPGWTQIRTVNCPPPSPAPARGRSRGANGCQRLEPAGNRLGQARPEERPPPAFLGGRGGGDRAFNMSSFYIGASGGERVGLWDLGMKGMGVGASRLLGRDVVSSAIGWMKMLGGVG